MIRKSKTIYIAAFSVIFLCGVSATFWWLSYDPVRHFRVSVPGMDKNAGSLKTAVQVVKIGENFTLLSNENDAAGANWPGFRGPDRDNIVKEKIPLTEKLDNIRERTRWKIPLGEGHAAPAIFAGKIYLLDYDEQKKSDALRCFSLATGKEIWRRDYRVHLKRNHGLSRTIPAVNNKYVVSIGPKCHVMCVDRQSGGLLWGIDLVKQYGTEVPFWYTGQCPLLEGDTVILAPGGKWLMVALDCKSGKTIWETPNPREWKMSHASVMKTVIDGKAMYIYFAIGGICGVSAEKSDAGKLLWEFSGFAPAVVAPSPVALDNGKILLTAGYGAGTALIRVKQQDGQWNVKMLQQFRPQDGIASEQQTPVFRNNTVFAILPKDAGGSRNELVAFSPDDCKTVKSSSGKTRRFGLGPYIFADGKFFVMDDEGEMSVFSVINSSLTFLDKAKVLDGQDAWGPMAFSSGLLLARDSKNMVCFDLRKR